MKCPSIPAPAPTGHTIRAIGQFCTVATPQFCTVATPQQRPETCIGIETPNCLFRPQAPAPIFHAPPEKIQQLMGILDLIERDPDEFANAVSHLIEPLNPTKILQGNGFLKMFFDDQSSAGLITSTFNISQNQLIHAALEATKIVGDFRETVKIIHSFENMALTIVAHITPAGYQRHRPAITAALHIACGSDLLIKKDPRIIRILIQQAQYLHYPPHLLPILSYSNYNNINALFTAQWHEMACDTHQDPLSRLLALHHLAQHVRNNSDDIWNNLEYIGAFASLCEDSIPTIAQYADKIFSELGSVIVDDDDI